MGRDGMGMGMSVSMSMTLMKMTAATTVSRVSRVSHP